MLSDLVISDYTFTCAVGTIEVSSFPKNYSCDERNQVAKTQLLEYGLNVLTSQCSLKSFLYST